MPGWLPKILWISVDPERGRENKNMGVVAIYLTFRASQFKSKKNNYQFKNRIKKNKKAKSNDRIFVYSTPDKKACDPEKALKDIDFQF